MKARCAKHYFISELLEAAPAVFISLSIGILWVIASFITGCEIPASGGVLVGAALVAELFLQKSAWLYAAQVAGLDSLKYDSHEKEFYIGTSHSNNEMYFRRDKFCVLKKMYQNSKSREILNSGAWQLHATAYRIKNILSWVIIGASLLGTAIWAFAHLLEDACCKCFSGC